MIERIIITIDTTNAVFDDDLTGEAARTLRALADDIDVAPRGQQIAKEELYRLAGIADAYIEQQQQEQTT